MQPRLHRFFRRLALRLSIVGLGMLVAAGTVLSQRPAAEQQIAWAATGGTMVLALLCGLLARRFGFAQRCKRQERRFAKYRDSIRRRQGNARASAARANDRRHLRQLARITLRELRYRRRQISPHVLDATAAFVDQHVGLMDFERVYAVYRTIAEADADALHLRLSDLVNHHSAA
jgi:hypothetical protein